MKTTMCLLLPLFLMSIPLGCEDQRRPPFQYYESASQRYGESNASLEVTSPTAARPDSDVSPSAVAPQLLPSHADTPSPPTVEEPLNNLAAQSNSPGPVESDRTLLNDASTTAAGGSDAQVNNDGSSPENLNPRRRLHRENRGTTASVEGGRFFGDQLMTQVMPDARRIPEGRIFPAEFDAHLLPSRLRVGDLFSISVVQNDAPRFGPILEGGGIRTQGSYFECKVEESGTYETKFKVQVFVMPHPNGNPDHELAIPINAVVLHSPTDERPDQLGRAHEASRLAGSFGQLSGGIDANFGADAAMALASKFLLPKIGQDKSAVCVLQDEIKQHTPCYVRINDDAVF